MKRPWLKFYPVDWRADPRLRMCSLGARGLWIDLISYMHEGEPYGHLTIDGVQPSIENIASLVARPTAEVRKALGELESMQVFSRDERGAIFSRRMVSDLEKSIQNSADGALGGNPDIPRGIVPKQERNRPYRRSDAPEKTRRIFERDGGNCHWCGVGLKFNPNGSPNGFHVDHVVAVCDGGSNDEENLVAACAECNHKRARLDSVGRSRMVSVGKLSDTKAQMLDARREKEGGGGARAEPLILVTQEAIGIADEVAAIAGLDPDPLATPPGWCGAAARAQMWLVHWTRDEILAGARAGMANKRDGPPETPRYFEKPIARIHLQLATPIAKIDQETEYARAATKTTGRKTMLDAFDDIAAEIAAKRRA